MHRHGLVEIESSRAEPIRPNASKNLGAIYRSIYRYCTFGDRGTYYMHRRHRAASGAVETHRRTRIVAGYLSHRRDKSEGSDALQRYSDWQIEIRAENHWLRVTTIFFFLPLTPYRIQSCMRESRVSTKHLFSVSVGRSCKKRAKQIAPPYSRLKV